MNKFKKLVVLDSNNIPEEELKTLAEELVIYKDIPSTDEEIIKRIGNSDGVIFDWTLVKPEIFDKCKDVKYLGGKFTGYGWFDWKGIANKGITITYSPNHSTEAVAELTIIHMLNLLRKIGENKLEENKVIGNEAKGKTLGIIGLGKIGMRVAEIADILGMKVIYYSKTRKNVKYEYFELDDLLKISDVVSFHCSLNKTTEGMFNAEKVKLMKDNSILLNLAHTKIFKENEIIPIIKQKKISVGIDAFAEEGINKDWLSVPNSFYTAQIGYCTKEAEIKRNKTTIENVLAFLKGTPQNVVS